MLIKLAFSTPPTCAPVLMHPPKRMLIKLIFCGYFWLCIAGRFDAPAKADADQTKEIKLVYGRVWF